MAYDRDLANRLRELLAVEDGVSERTMFGGLAFLVHGHMALAASRDGGLLVRCEPERTEALLARRHARRFEMGGRALEGWLRVDIDGVRSKRELQRWVGEGMRYVRTLPPKGR